MHCSAYEKMIVHAMEFQGLSVPCNFIAEMSAKEIVSRYQ